jgi:hypothetical protein
MEIASTEKKPKKERERRKGKKYGFVAHKVQFKY